MASSPYHDIGKRYLPKGCGAIFTFGIRGGIEAGFKTVGFATMPSIPIYHEAGSASGTP